jgi:hypothetical protein
MIHKKLVNHFRNIKWLGDDLVLHHKNYSKYNPNVPNFLYMRLGKTGGTSIFRGVIEPTIYGETSVGAPHMFEPEEDTLERWLEDMNDVLIKNDYFKFTFVRNPFDKLVSAYFFIKKRQVRYSQNTIDLNSFENFIKTELMDENGEATDDHWAHQWSAVTTEDGDFFMDYVGRFENIVEDWRYVANKLNLPEYLPHLKPLSGFEDHTDIAKSHPNLYASGKDYRKYYTDELVEIVSNIYKKDLEVFGYEF